jgi:multisubunit Na+/H+ antiporter MnhB subunit
MRTVYVYVYVCVCVCFIHLISITNTSSSVKDHFITRNLRELCTQNMSTIVMGTIRFTNTVLRISVWHAAIQDVILTVTRYRPVLNPTFLLTFSTTE